jgi:outer membrane lipoprotein SlyB
MEQATNRIHPLVAGAAVAVIVAAGVAVAAVTGNLPGSKADTTPVQPVASTPEKQPVKPAQQPKQQVASAKPAPAPRPVSVCKDCGTIVEVKEVDVPGKGTGIGAVAGGVGGAVIGRQVGENRTGTAIGAVVGAVAGHQIERQARMHKRYDITVKMNDGSIRSLSDESGTPVTLKSGDKVKVAQDGTVKPL